MSIIKTEKEYEELERRLATAAAGITAELVVFAVWVIATYFALLHAVRSAAAGLHF